ncbi:TRAP transporter substrate-binding protein [Hominifimenecus sp. rT4P-3]|uniref:TRAP transporter substrate-binding protein n=1 Tax=Hominifimenecus sp. rT4P-3 TaxID=3242979 RepID=UPI003DA27AD6
MKKWTAMGLALAMMASLASCGGSADKGSTTAAPATTAATTAAAANDTTAAEGGSDAAGAEAYADLEEMTLIIASSASSSLKNYEVQSKVAEEIHEKTGGKLTIELSWDGVLGDDSALLESVMGGNIAMACMASSPILNYIPEVGVFDAPAVFDSAEAAHQGVAQLADTFEPLFNEVGLSVLDLGSINFRALSTNTKIEKPEDFQGMSIRTMENKYHMGFWQNLGCKPTPIAMSDLYLSLQQGLVSAQDNAAVAVYANKFFEVQDYYMQINCFLNTDLVLINKELYDSLPAPYQECLKEFAKAYHDGAYEAAGEAESTAIANMGDGITVLPVTDEIREAFREAAKPVWNEIADAIGADIVDTYLATGGNTRE